MVFGPQVTSSVFCPLVMSSVFCPQVMSSVFCPQVMSSALEGEEYIPERRQDAATAAWIRDCMFILAAQMGEQG